MSQPFPASNRPSTRIDVPVADASCPVAYNRANAAPRDVAGVRELRGPRERREVTC